jgi:hypothetical protein
MTGREFEVRERIFRERPYVCEICGRPLWGWGVIPQLAHRIPQRKWCLKRWGKEVIHHPRNLVLVCGLECNQKAQINPEGLEAAALAAEIMLEISRGGKVCS